MSLTPGLIRPPAHEATLASRSTVPILLIDDNAAKRLALKAILAPLGYVVVEADSGAAGLRCLMAHDFAVILLDVRMPIMDGFETAALIRLRRQSEMTPIIFITAHESGEVMTDRYAEGAVDFITAPVHPDELRAKVSVFANLFLQAQAIAARALEVQSSADQLRRLTETAPIGIFETDSHNRYVYTNARWSEITGIPAASAVGQEWHIVIDDDQRELTLADFQSSRGQDEEYSARLERRVPGSPTRVMLLTSKPMLDDDGGVTGWVGTLADVTAEARAEAAMAEARDAATAASQLKSDFLANMSHEIRTPMNGVIGLTELLLETDLDDQQRDFMQTLSNSGEALMTVINGILDFSKIEKGKLEVENIEFSVQEVVEEVLDLLARSAQTKGLELMSVLEPSVPATVIGDPSRLRQVLTNLAGNAIKFTESGEVVVRVTATENAASATDVRFELTDTGVGIAADKMAIIFDPFTQADTSTTREYGGTGLGLAISSQLVALMGGEVGITSSLGAGSTFWFTIAVESAPHVTDVVRSADDSDLVDVRCLVIEENASQAAILSDYLTRWGMSVGTTSSAADAQQLLRAATAEGRPVSLVLLDQSAHTHESGKPALVGLEAATNVVLMSWAGDQNAAARASGAVTLTRPIHREDLRSCVREALGLPHEPVASEFDSENSADQPEAGRLLLAEDNLINQKVAVAMLTRAGYHVDTVRNGAEAVRAAAGKRYDAILMDCHMPQMNGYEATAAIRDHEGPGRHTPIIAITAGARGEDRVRCLAEGMDEYVSKPMRKEPLLGIVRQLVRSNRDSRVSSPEDVPRAV